MERLRLTVSPFDGVNRIRFKGSPEEFRIAECEFRILKRAFEFNSQFAIPISQFFSGLSATISCKSRLPRNVFDFQTDGQNSSPARRLVQTHQRGSASESQQV